MADYDTFGITLPVADWRALMELAQRADCSPSDCLRILIRQAAHTLLVQNPHEAARRRNRPGDVSRACGMWGNHGDA